MENFHGPPDRCRDPWEGFAKYDPVGNFRRDLEEIARDISSHLFNEPTEIQARFNGESGGNGCVELFIRKDGEEKIIARFGPVPEQYSYRSQMTAGVPEDPSVRAIITLGLALNPSFVKIGE
jgi:hypothetical protein